MCGITGFKNFSKKRELENSLQSATDSLKLRGPDFNATYLENSVGLGHTRLSIIDTSSNANQPMTDPSGRFTLAFNGEIYNYRELAKNLNVEFKSSSDTEVLLYLLINEGVDCLKKLNGFFSFAFYDSHEDILLIARDRMGIKPLHYYQCDDFFVFGSEMKALFNYPVPRILNKQGLYAYLQLTYLPHEMSMIDGVKKLLPGHFICIRKNDLINQPYFQLETPIKFTGSYEKGKDTLVSLFEKSVQKRMVADVPLGAFLSGGTDSSAVVSMASTFDKNLNTFSIGYTDHPYFDETHYAELVANKFRTNHTTFSLSNSDLLESLPDIIEYLDEPFADSSAIPTYILSKRVSEKMKVALSGDGADELFGGYYKHLAFLKSQEKSFSNVLIRLLHPIIQSLPKSRSAGFSNLMRRLTKYGELLKLNNADSYWHLASFNHRVSDLLIEDQKGHIQSFTQSLTSESLNFDEFLDLDLQVVLPGDMLTKVDLMSMANSLEVRVPFLDKELVAFARALPPAYKVKGNHRKRILQDAFEHILPKELHHRSKKGFEVPMLNWLRNELESEVNEIVFNPDFLHSQQIFKVESIMALKKKLHSRNPGDVHSIIWSLYVFQVWFKKWMV